MAKWDREPYIPVVHNYIAETRCFWDFSYVLAEDLKVHVKFEGSGIVTQDAMERFLNLLSLNASAFPKKAPSQYEAAKMEREDSGKT